MDPDTARHSISAFKYLAWIAGFLGDGTTLAGGLLVAREAWDTKRYIRAIENIERGIRALVERGYTPTVNGLEIEGHADSELLVHLRAVRTGLSLIVVGFFLAIIARAFDVMVELK